MRAEIDPGAGVRLRKAKFGGVEEIAVQRGQHDLSDAKLRGRAVKRVADHRMSKGRKMNADLVCAAGVKLHFEERGGIDTGQDVPVGAGFASVTEDDAAVSSHAGAALGVASDGQVDGAATFLHLAVHEGDVGFLDLALAEAFAESGVSGVIFGDEDDAGGVFVEAMHDAGAKSVATLRQSLTPTKEGVDECAVRGTGTGVYGHAGGFVDGNDVGVFVEDVDGNGFGLGAKRRTRLDLDLDVLTGTEAV